MEWRDAILMFVYAVCVGALAGLFAWAVTVVLRLAFLAVVAWFERWPILDNPLADRVFPMMNVWRERGRREDGTQ